MSEVPNLEGAACAELAPGIAEKYFDINPQRQKFEAQTARAICGGCAIRAVCLEQALNKPRTQITGITAGLAPSQIRALKLWHQYDLGELAEEPPYRRPDVEYPSMSEADTTVVEYHRTATLTFEERVRGVFLDLREGKYNAIGGISTAIADIALIRTDMDADAVAAAKYPRPVSRAY
ncbi:hypothetical protein ABIB48_002634 [Arthrobacter sp. UYCu511]|uniref:WhiB family transcriptional regulator n=1 Tax=Arthrobacter sp. UYCu511 TaxID=3156337 RepID=UPI003394F2A8